MVTSYGFIVILGVILSDNLSWQKNTSYICAKARSKIWRIRRMIRLELDTFTMFDVYTKEVRSILELAVPVWHSGLTKNQTRDIERIQRISFQIIFWPACVKYKQACNFLSTQTLEERTVKLCLKFARQNVKSDNCMFNKPANTVNKGTVIDLLENTSAEQKYIRRAVYLIWQSC